MKGRNLLLIGILTLVCLVYLFPIYWTVITSLKTNPEVFTRPPVFFPSQFTLSNFYVSVDVFRAVSQTAVGSIPWMIDSTIIAVIATIVSTFLIAAPAAYSLVRYIKSVWLARLILFMTMIPEAVFVVPFFIIDAKLSLLNTWWGLILVYISFSAPFSTWLLWDSSTTSRRAWRRRPRSTACLRIRYSTR